MASYDISLTHEEMVILVNLVNKEVQRLGNISMNPDFIEKARSQAFDENMKLIGIVKKFNRA
jgi:hypothetical protein